MLALTSLCGNSQRLDGGAMFGNAPRVLWQRWSKPDEEGRIQLACRSFLVQDGKRRILIEAGVGAFFEPKLRERYGVVEGHHVLLSSLAAHGWAPEDIDVVLLSHLHFDHAGGLLSSYAPGEPLSLAFPRAQFVVGQEALQRAETPHPRDRASFIPELLPLLKDSGRLSVVKTGDVRHEYLGDRIRLRTSHGHTPGLLIPLLHGREERAVFCADLVPGLPWTHLPITMGYDRFPEQLIDEKRALYEEEGVGCLLLYAHDWQLAAGRLSQSDRGRYEISQQWETLDAFDLDKG